MLNNPYSKRLAILKRSASKVSIDLRADIGYCLLNLGPITLDNAQELIRHAFNHFVEGPISNRLQHRLKTHARQHLVGQLVSIPLDFEALAIDGAYHIAFLVVVQRLSEFQHFLVIVKIETQRRRKAVLVRYLIYLLCAAIPACETINCTDQQQPLEAVIIDHDPVGWIDNLEQQCPALIQVAQIKI